MFDAARQVFLRASVVKLLAFAAFRIPRSEFKGMLDLFRLLRIPHSPSKSFPAPLKIQLKK